MLSPNNQYTVHTNPYVTVVLSSYLRILRFRAESDCEAKDRPGLPDMGTLALDSTQDADWEMKFPIWNPVRFQFKEQFGPYVLCWLRVGYKNSGETLAVMNP